MGSARILAALGGLIGAGSVVVGLAGDGGTAPYQSRLPFALAAFGLAAVAGAAPWWPRRSSRASGFIVFPAGVVGFLCTQLWFINTSYVAALPLWLLASLLLLLAASRTPR
ncbi:MAG TPA: hypothetical protein VGT60_08935 [Candidatus Limnocylindria bacterium]|nr:hypothetical protein [Candidatus Limnocylindria bacterium]